MGFSMFAPQTSPIAIDFGTSSIKLLQIGNGDRPSTTAAAELAIPDNIRFDQDKLLAYCAEKLPKILSAGSFKGRRVVMAIPTGMTFIQHMQLVKSEKTNRDDLIKSQLQYQMGCSPQSVVVRSMEVADIHRDGQVQSEAICLAMARDTVMRYVELLKRCKLNVVGVHTAVIALLRAFDHLNRRDSDVDLTNLYVDLGWGGTLVTIAHGTQIAFARHIQIGGRHFDQLISQTLHCDMPTARTHRLQLASPMVTATEGTPPPEEDHGSALLRAAASAHAINRKKPGRGKTATAEMPERRSEESVAATCHPVPDGDPPKAAATVDLTELVETISDELSMCLRYHKGLFPHRSIDRAIFVGGEARQVWLCQHVAKSLGAPVQMGNPVTRAAHASSLKTPGVSLDDPQPGWAVAYGLCTAPTDL